MTTDGLMDETETKQQSKTKATSWKMLQSWGPVLSNASYITLNKVFCLNNNLEQQRQYVFSLML